MDKYINQKCQKHGDSKHVLEGRGYYRCTICRVEAVQRRREKLKALAVEYKGGKCEHCGYNKCIQALDFHHLDPTEKDFAIGNKGQTRSWGRIKQELDKCILVCSNCHREIHAEQYSRDATVG